MNTAEESIRKNGHIIHSNSDKLDKLDIQTTKRGDELEDKIIASKK